MLKLKPEAEADIIVGSVPTLVRMSRLNMYDPLEFKAIVIDECHHATATSWVKILNYFGALDEQLEIKVLGFTATLERADGMSLGKVFDEVVFERSLLTMIEKRELCDVRISSIKVDLSLAGVGTKFGDYDPATLAEAVNKENVNLQVVRAYLQLRNELKLKATLVFCVDINHCKTLCGVLQAGGVNAQYVTGETVRHERRAILEDFKNGKIDVLCNVLVFTEGTDIPNIDSMILARPTKSRPLLTQMIGRGLRLHQSKDVCHVIDMVGTTKIGVLSVPSLFGLPEGHDVHRKTLLELRDDKEKYDAAAEEQAARDRQQQVQEIFELQKKIEDISMQFDVIEGFAALLDKNIDLYKDSGAVNDAFRESPIRWVRLEYDVWGFPTRQSGRYYTITREHNEGSVEFSLESVERATRETLIASNFKCARTRTTEISRGNLSHVLCDAERVLRNDIRRHSDLLKATSKQVQLLHGQLKATVARTYNEAALKPLREQLEQLSMNRASALIFARACSVNSLWVKWELSKMLGPPPHLQRRAERETKKLEKLASSIQ